MARPSLISLRMLQSLFACANLGLSTYVIHWYHTNTNRQAPTSLIFLLFASIFSILSIPYLELGPRFLRRLSHPYAALAIESINTTIYFAGLIALAVFLGGLKFCRGSVCSASRADAVIVASAFCVWIASTTLTAKDIIIGGVSGRRKTGQMLQV